MRLSLPEKRRFAASDGISRPHAPTDAITPRRIAPAASTPLPLCPGVRAVGWRALHALLDEERP